MNENRITNSAKKREINQINQINQIKGEQMNEERRSKKKNK